MKTQLLLQFTPLLRFIFPILITPVKLVACPIARVARFSNRTCEMLCPSEEYA
ncbi:MAG: hypothetical protein NTY09_08705 [bacterium]|nr:hypothetical protein [bacterium]